MTTHVNSNQVNEILTTNQMNIDKLLKDNYGHSLFNILGTNNEKDFNEIIQNIIKQINDNKYENGISGKNEGIPSGEFEINGKIIDVDIILSKYPKIKDYYKNAISRKDNNIFDKTNNILAGILYMIAYQEDEKSEEKTETNKKIIQKKNGKEIELEDFDMDKLVIRDNIAKQISDIRNGSDLTKGDITLRDGIKISLGDQKIASLFTHYKEEYANTSDEKRLEELDTEFAERLILAYGYYIQINNSLISADDPNYQDSINAYRYQYCECKNGLTKIGLKDIEDLHIQNKNGEEILVIRQLGDNLLKTEKNEKNYDFSKLSDEELKNRHEDLMEEYRFRAHQENGTEEHEDDVDLMKELDAIDKEIKKRKESEKKSYDFSKLSDEELKNRHEELMEEYRFRAHQENGTEEHKDDNNLMKELDAIDKEIKKRKEKKETVEDEKSAIDIANKTLYGDDYKGNVNLRLFCRKFGVTLKYTNPQTNENIILNKQETLDFIKENGIYVDPKKYSNIQYIDKDGNIFEMTSVYKKEDINGKTIYRMEETVGFDTRLYQLKHKGQTTVIPPEDGDNPKPPVVIPPEDDDDPKPPVVIPPEDGDDPKPPVVIPPEDDDDPKPPVVIPPEDDDDPKPQEITIDAAISDVTESYEDMISREIENEINEERNNSSWYNILTKGKLFLGRGLIRKKKMKAKIKDMERRPFTKIEEFDSEMGTQVNRHDFEQKLFGDEERGVFGKVERENLFKDKPELESELKDLCKKYILGEKTEEEFKDEFNKFTQEKLGLPKENQFVSTNILEKLKEVRKDNEVFKLISDEISQYTSDHKKEHIDKIKSIFDDYFKQYQKNHNFKERFDSLLEDKNISKEKLDEKLQKLIKQEKALTQLSADNMKLKLDLLTGGKGAYQVNNKDRENWLYKFGNKLDKMPRWGQALTVAGISASGIAVTALGGSALAATLTVAGLTGTKAAIKKFTHHTKEQNTYERNFARNYEEELKTINEYKRMLETEDGTIIDSQSDVLGFKKIKWKYTESEDGKTKYSKAKRYKALRQLQLYEKTTQSELQQENEGNTQEITTLINVATKDYAHLNDTDKNALHCTLIDAYARLQAYRETGHNFLKSKEVGNIERDFYNLELALDDAAKKIKGDTATIKDLSTLTATKEVEKETKEKDGTTTTKKETVTVNFNEEVNRYKTDYNSAKKTFSKERGILAAKYGIGTAAVTFGTSALTQYLSGTGMFAKEAVPGTEGIAGTEDSFNSHNTGTVSDQFGMGKYEFGTNNEILNTARDNISGLNPQDTVTLHLGAGTDGTAVRAGSALLNSATYDAKLDQVIDVINSSSLSNKAELINQVQNGFGTSGFTNANLHGMRCLETIEETVRGAGNFGGSLNISYDTALDIDSSVIHDATSRVGQAFLEINEFVAGTPGVPGTDSIPGGWKHVIALPNFWNTFQWKKKKSENGDQENTPNQEQGKNKGKNREKGNKDNKENFENKKEGNKKTENSSSKNGENVVIPLGETNETGGNHSEHAEDSEQLSDNQKKEIAKDIANAFRYGDEDFKEKYKDNQLALSQLEEAKDFWNNFSQINFYDSNKVDKLKEQYKDNLYILGRIHKETHSPLKESYKHKLNESEISRFEEKAKTLVQEAIQNKDFARLGVRPTILIKVSDDLIIPFYRSSGLGNKHGVQTEKFYPIFGQKNGRLNKGRESEINNYYGSPILAALAKEIDNQYKDDKYFGTDIWDWKFSDDDFENKMNIGKQPTNGKDPKETYQNINTTLDKVSQVTP